MRVRRSAACGRPAGQPDDARKVSDERCKERRRLLAAQQPI